MGITLEGIEGEQKLFCFLKQRNIKFFQPDAIGQNESFYEMYEVKHQERFMPPPFEGHGLPKWQVEARMKFESDTGIKCVFVVFEKNSNKIFYQYLSVLEGNRMFFDTNGLKPRRVYDLRNFYSYEE